MLSGGDWASITSVGRSDDVVLRLVVWWYYRCGTPGYVAPEILCAGVNEGYGDNVDIFSVSGTSALIDGHEQEEKW